MPDHLATVRVTVANDICEIAIDNPPVNALGATVRRQIFDAIAAAQIDPSVKAIVLRGSRQMFSAGADITEFGKPPARPGLAEVCSAIEASAKPVVAAIHKAALGGGLELALASHYRIATPDAKLGLPEVTLGILPGAGGTQRLPRLIGAEAALDMIVFGKPVTGSAALGSGLIDRMAEEESLAVEARAHARSLTEPRSTGAIAIANDPSIPERFAEANAWRIAGLDAQKACIEAVAAAMKLPIAEGLAVEQSLFAKLVEGEQSKALRHIFRAERAAAKMDDLPSSVTPRHSQRVGVLGAGTMGTGIAASFLLAGLEVTLVEMATEPLERGCAAIRKALASAQTKGRMTHGEAQTALERLTATLDFDALAECDLIVEAVYEDMAVKKEVFARLDKLARSGALLASNTSYLSIDEIAAATSRPHDVLGLHFFSPAHIMKLVEVVRGAATAPEVIVTALDLARRIGKVPVVARVGHGFIANRMLAARQANAQQLLLEGATPEQIDAVHTRFGMPMGPFQMADLAGLDLGWHRDPTRADTVREALCAAGRWGQKTAAGFYDYDENRRASPSPAVGQVVANFRERAGIMPRPIEEDEIRVRTLYTVVNEGAKVLQEGIAQRASDIDVAWVHGYGWPRHKGGPMFWADTTGLDSIVSGLERYADAMGTGFSLSPLLLRSVARGTALEREPA